MITDDAIMTVKKAFADWRTIVSARTPDAICTMTQQEKEHGFAMYRHANALYAALQAQWIAEYTPKYVSQLQIGDCVRFTCLAEESTIIAFGTQLDFDGQHTSIVVITNATEYARIVSRDDALLPVARGR